ncbi:MAG: DUF262 domain-containing protein, partial [Bryobacteraceae bacterium]|nr:DUF262 domain-containing protein [Bryobacteraceae bacterium]
YFQEFTKLTLNRTPLSRERDDAYKVWPTNQDRAEFRAVMGQHGIPSGPSDDGEDDDDADDADDGDGDGEEAGGLLQQAYAFFRRRVGDWIATGDSRALERRFEVLHLALCDDLTLVVIDLELADDPQEIFETLNALGTPLLPADLVKNHLFHLAAQQHLDGEQLHARHWAEFDTEKKYWRKEVRQGRVKRPRLDQFLGHLLQLQTARLDPSSRLFEGFKAYLAQHPAVSVEQHMAKFREYASVYRRFEQFPPASRAGTFFYRLSALDFTTVYPLLLEVVRRHADRDGGRELDAILVDIESFLVRRTVCRLTARSYGEFFLRLIKACRESDDFSHARIRAFLLGGTSEIAVWPMDDQFREHWMTTEFYRKLKKSCAVVLQALEDEMRTSKSEVQRVERSVVSVEHLMPQKWEEHWPPPHRSYGDTPEQSARQRKAATHRIGNLTLLTKPLNTSISNGAWAAKRAEIKKHSVLLMQRGFLDCPTWDEVQIDARSEELFRLAVKVWPRP